MNSLLKSATLIAFYLASQILNGCSGQLTVIRGPSYYPSTFNNRQARTVTCVAEDDGGALVLNYNLEWKYYASLAIEKQEYRDLSPSTTNPPIIDCPLSDSFPCTTNWERNSWTIASSLDKAMGPVLDKRWEEFQDQRFGYGDGYRKLDVSESGAVVFSFRGKKDARLLLCETADPHQSPCYWIIIGGWENKNSVIRDCPNGVPAVRSLPEFPCKNIRKDHEHPAGAVSLTEWRTFILKWSSETQTIALYDQKQLLFEYQVQKMHLINHLHYQNPTPEALFRFHFYNYLHTTKPGAQLISPEWNAARRDLCIEMAVGLCSECQMDISIVDNANHRHPMRPIIPQNSSVGHGLPTWQFIRRILNVDFKNPVRLQMTTSTNGFVKSPLWAVANVRGCESKAALRQSSITVQQDYMNDAYFWPNITCQKLDYSGNFVVNSFSTTSTSPNDLRLCPEGKVGPHCTINCKDVGSDYTCKGLSICSHKAGCRCAQGFSGEKCSDQCNNKFGFGCTLDCGQCYGETCNAFTGFCPKRCTGSYLPPYCRIKIEAPNVNSITATSARIFLNVEQYVHKANRCIFQIKDDDGRWDNVGYGVHQIVEGATELYDFSNNLKPGINYSVRGVFYPDQFPVNGEETRFQTPCKPTQKFYIQPGERNLMLNTNIPQQRDSCSPQWYSVLLKVISINSYTPFKLQSIPYEIPNLKPYTDYEIIVSGGNQTIYSETVRTLEAAPSAIRNLRRKHISDREVTLEWDPPSEMNGVIKIYFVHYQLELLKGCQDLGRSTPHQDKSSVKVNVTTVHLIDLHPYAKYSVNVTATTSKFGPPEKYQFETEESKMPTSVVSNLRLEHDTLKWDPQSDCTTISGPTEIIKLTFNGISEWVKDFIDERQTSRQYFKLGSGAKANPQIIYPATTYKVRAYVTRGSNKVYDSTRYEELTFTTKPKAPPAVRDLEIYEIDFDKNTVSLRWSSPQPPVNGDLKTYSVSFCKYSTFQSNDCLIPWDIPLYSTCDFWENYLCSTLIREKSDGFIHLWANNEGVDEAGVRTALLLTDIQKKEPDPPENVKSGSSEKGTISLTWSHPWRTYNKLQLFRIKITYISTELRNTTSQGSYHYLEYNVTKYQKKYSMNLDLLPSTLCEFCVSAKTIKGEGPSRCSQIWTQPDMAFKDKVVAEDGPTNCTIVLHLPSVLNDTRNSMMHVIVKGPRRYDPDVQLDSNLAKHANVKNDQVAWRAASFPTPRKENQQFVIGDNKTYEGAWNCPLEPGETYEIVIVVRGGGRNTTDQMVSISTQPMKLIVSPLHGVWRSSSTVWLVVVLIITVATLMILIGYSFCRKRDALLKILDVQNIIRLSQDTANADPRLSVTYKDQQPISLISKDSDVDKEFPLENIDMQQDPNISDTPLDNGAMDSVKIYNFEKYVKQAVENGLLERQYEMIPRDQTRPWDYGELAENKSKNRYKNLIAYDETRVKLEKLPGKPYSDYINASYIDGYKKEKAYIATQGPKPETVIDFWRMIWQEKVLIICMLTNIMENKKKKCEQYWPNINTRMRYGKIIVVNTNHQVFMDYTYRTFQISFGQETRNIEHLHYTAWPDHGIPVYTHSLVAYLKKLSSISPGNGPIVVHCSAGVGRTGTIILCDICLRRAKAEGVIDMFTTTKSIRSQRANMVDNQQQYLLAHVVVVEALLNVPTMIPCDEALPQRIKQLKQQLSLQQARLNETAWQGQVLQSSIVANSLPQKNLEKNRFPELAADGSNRIYLKRYPTTDADSDYISAVYVDGVKKKQFLTSQLPLPSTLADFWRMIAELKTELVLMLQSPEPEDATCCELLPRDAEFAPVPYIKVIAKTETDSIHFSSQTLALHDASEKPTRTQSVTILRCKDWGPGRNGKPPTTETLVSLWQASESISRGEGPMVVLCYDGVTGCGLYVALSFLLERMAVERECDVCLAIRCTRRSRQQFLQPLEQFEYLYDAAITYCECFQTYANFQ